MKTILWSLLLISLTSFSGCDLQKNDTVQPGNSDNLVGEWSLSGPKTGFTITLEITLKSKEGSSTLYRIGGLSPVNQYGADITVQSDGTMTVGSIITTKRGGSTEEMNTQKAYYNSLQKAAKAEIVGGKLRIKVVPDAQFSLWETLIYDK